jgi:hypothetical protein
VVQRQRPDSINGTGQHGYREYCRDGMALLGLLLTLYGGMGARGYDA